MRAFGILSVATVMVVSPAVAADDVQFGPAPAWVRPVEAPKAPTKISEGPARLLLSSQQVNFEAGRQSVYLETAIRIESPQGLAAGNIALPWNPATDALTVHRLTIERGDRSIDVLAAGQKFTVVRREANLENATLDGVLTASIQPEGLQVGDTLRFAGSNAPLNSPWNDEKTSCTASLRGAVGRAGVQLPEVTDGTGRARDTCSLSFDRWRLNTCETLQVGNAV